MKLAVLIVGMFIATIAEAQSVFWCSARSPYSSEVFNRSGVTVEEAKGKARIACSDRYARCEVVQCWEESLYRFSCHAARRGYNELRPGGYRIQSNNVDQAARRVVYDCERNNGLGACSWLCYTNSPRVNVAVPVD